MVNDKLRDLVSSQAGNMLSFVATALTSVTGAGFAIFNVLTLVVVTPVVGFYLLRDWPRVIGMVDSWLPHRYADVIRAQAREVDRILSAWVRGQALCCLILALYYASALTVAGLDLGLIVGMAAGLLSFIPYVGSITGGVTAIGLALAQFPHWRGVVVVGGVLVVGPDAGGLRDLSALPRRPGGAAGGVGDLRAVRRRRGVRLPRRDAGGADRGDHRRAVPVLAAPLSGEPALPGPAERAVERFPARLVPSTRDGLNSRLCDHSNRRANGGRNQTMPALATRLEVWRPHVLSILRLLLGLLFMEHGLSKLFSFPAPFPSGQPAMFTLLWFAGIIESLGGLMLAIGLFTRPVAFIMSGEMAIAYFYAHQPRNFFPLLNGGEAAILFCFIFLYICVAGGGSWSVDRMRASDRY